MEDARNLRVGLRRLRDQVELDLTARKTQMEAVRFQRIGLVRLHRQGPNLYVNVSGQVTAGQ